MQQKTSWQWRKAEWWQNYRTGSTIHQGMGNAYRMVCCWPDTMKTGRTTGKHGGRVQNTRETESFWVTPEKTEELPNSLVKHQDNRKKHQDFRKNHNSSTSASSTASVQTGDETNILLWIVVMILAASGIAVIIICDRKRKYNR